MRAEVLPRREAGKPDLSISMVWISPPWPIPIHEDFTEGGAENRCAPGQQAGGIPGVVLTGSPKWGLPFCRSVSMSEPSEKVEAPLGPPSSQPQPTLPPLPLCTAAGQQTPAGFREAWGGGSLGGALSGIDRGQAGLEGPTRLYWHAGMSGQKLRVSAG